ncbi:RNA polymerase sigma factor [Delftia tsuruhatensis]|uniref:sigma-70 family RNA polymerase sigma factor n=1 Tax=Delftia tsuruhatensis TaxID=180282 RepID=UPI0006421074|nr:sigma-70 family RNA polymerase sigma factor [Delftia tsuruhatensis]KLO59431.1 RNA polymerase sigma factor [Delftia tsuruhatensis]
MPAADRALVPDVATLYSDHHGWLLGWLRKRLGNAFDAADLTQDTYVRLLGRSGAEIQAIREPRALLMTIAQGLAANLCRKRCVEQAYLDALALMPEAVAQSPEHRAIVLQTLVEVDRLLALLPLPVRQAFLLSQIDGMRQADIAAELGLSVPTVRRHIARAVVQVCFLDDDGA